MAKKKVAKDVRDAELDLSLNRAKVLGIVNFVGENPLVDVNSVKRLPRYSDEELTRIAASVGLTLAQLQEAGRVAKLIYADPWTACQIPVPQLPCTRQEIVAGIIDNKQIQQYDQKKTRKNTTGLQDDKVRMFLDLVADEKRKVLVKFDAVYGAIAAVAFPKPKYS